MNRTWMDNADEFAALSRQGKDLRLAILVACSVHAAKPGRPSNNRDVGGKCTAREFAVRANTHHHRITRHLEAWQSMADEGLVSHTRHLGPAHVNDITTTPAIEQAWRDLAFATIKQAAQAVTVTSQPNLHAVERGVVEACSMMVQPALRQAEMVRGSLAKLDGSEREVVRLLLLEVVSTFQALADSLADATTARQLA